MTTVVLLTGPPGTGKSTLASVAADVLGGAPVLGWDWAMAGIRTFPELQELLESGGRDRHRAVGWSILWSLATAQLREGRSVVLDGVARQGEADATRRLAASEGAASVVVVTACRDRVLHRRRIEGRTRAIPGWYELDWPSVEGSLAHWSEPTGADAYLDAVDPLTVNAAAVRALLGRPAEPTPQAG